MLSKQIGIVVNLHLWHELKNSGTKGCTVGHPTREQQQSVKTPNRTYNLRPIRYIM